MTTYIAWAFLLIIQNAAFTLVSRARNSGSIAFHAWASMASNSVWFLCQLILVSSITDMAKRGAWHEAVWLCVFYAVSTTVGATAMHWFSMRYLERGNRRIGAS